MFEINTSENGFYIEIKLNGEYIGSCNDEDRLGTYELEGIINAIAHRLAMSVTYGEAEF